MGVAYRYGTKIKVGGTTISGDQLASINITRGRNAPLMWSISAGPDPSRYFSPLNNAIFRADVFTDEITVGRPWSIYIQIGGSTKVFDSLILLGPDRGSSASAFNSTFAGTDYTRLLEISNQSMDSWVSTPANIYKTHDVVGDILSNFGVGNSHLICDNIPLRQVHFQGQAPIDVINTVAHVGMAEWFFKGNQFVLQQPKQLGVDWTYKDYKSFPKLGWKETPPATLSEVTVVRTDPSAQYEEFEEEGETACGLVTISLSEEKYMPQLRIIQDKWGTITEINWIDTNGKFDTEGGYNGLVKGCKFVFQQEGISNPPPNISSLAYWKIQISGLSGDMIGLISDFDQEYSVEVKNDAWSDKYGKLPAMEPITNNMIPNEEWARKHGERVLKEQQRLLETVTVQVGLNPWIDPGDVVKLTDYGSAVSGLFYAEIINHDITQKHAFTNLTCSKFIPALP